MWDASATLPAGGREWLPALDVPEPGRQSRLTVFFRMLLLIPQYIVYWLLSIVAFVVAVLGWFGALITGRLPEFAANFLTGYVEYGVRVEAYLMLLVDSYPPFRFEAPEHPVRTEVRPGELNRLAVFFRLILVIPAAIIQGVLLSGWWAVSFISWLVVLFLGRMPRPLFEATAAITRYRFRYQAYFLMLSSAYPKGLFGEDSLDSVAGTGPVSATRPLVMGSSGRILLVVFIVLGILAYGTSSITASVNAGNDDDTGYAQRPAVTAPAAP
ncbi:DUF4389 domain-containing protein [Kitasatospora sp. NPDC096147]|uniref:DUF4389 domain-containing protein n=1 Tax=Kitasatospora sp. NPDC096147 TaxID=3364093 RepID=UPI00381512AA